MGDNPVAVNFNVDVNQILGAVFNHAEQRNDLGVIIQNGLPMQLETQFKVISGSFALENGSPSLAAVTTPNASASCYAFGVDAKGAGSEVKIYVKSKTGPGTWGFYFFARPNRENQWTAVGLESAATPSDIYTRLDNMRRFGANEGPQTFDLLVDKVLLRVSMTTEGGTRATARIQFEPAASRANDPAVKAVKSALKMIGMR